MDIKGEYNDDYDTEIYMTRNSEVIAVIGYRVIESESTVENRK